ncbi:MAG TPA: hypothetical protein VEF35_00050 [Candidatus Bathyarchaeia archaeon]|nr:hypothetical protein [Candidatus Bathyarchaeia archaeon]
MVLDMVIAQLVVPAWFGILTYVMYGLAYIGIAVINIIHFIP